MADIEISVAPHLDDMEKDEVLALMDADIESFSKYMETLPSPVGSPLSRPEKALLKTYLVAKVRRKF